MAELFCVASGTADHAVRDRLVEWEMNDELECIRKAVVVALIGGFEYRPWKAPVKIGTEYLPNTSLDQPVQHIVCPVMNMRVSRKQGMPGPPNK
jgi:hypothetical protein